MHKVMIYIMLQLYLNKKLEMFLMVVNAILARNFKWQHLKIIF